MGNCTEHVKQQDRNAAKLRYHIFYDESYTTPHFVIRLRDRSSLIPISFAHCPF